MAATLAHSSPSRIDQDHLAQRLLAAWCSMTNRSPECMPAMIKSRTERDLVGVLVYALRKKAALGVLATARVVGMESDATPVALLQGRMVQLIEQKLSATPRQRLDQLLLQAGLPAESKQQSVGPREINDRKIHNESMRAFYQDRLDTAGPHFVQMVVSMFPASSPEQIIRGRVRYALIAVLYRVVIDGFSQSMVADFLGCDSNTVALALKKVHVEIMNHLEREFGSIITFVCKGLRIEPELLCSK